MGHQRRAREAQPEHMMYRVFLTNHLMNLGDLLRRTGKPDEAAKLAEEAAGLWPRHPQQLLGPAVLLAACVESAGQGDTPEVKARRDRFGRMAVEILDPRVRRRLPRPGLLPHVPSARPDPGPRRLPGPAAGSIRPPAA